MSLNSVLYLTALWSSLALLPITIGGHSAVSHSNHENASASYKGCPVQVVDSDNIHKVQDVHHFNDNPATGAWKDPANWNAPAPIGGCSGANQLCSIDMSESVFNSIEELLSHYAENDDLDGLRQDDAVSLKP